MSTLRLTIVSILLWAGAAQATEFYLDPVNGNDANPGTSQSRAWKTNVPANAHAWQNNDALHIAGGSTMACNTGVNGSCLYLSGNLASPVVIDNNFNPQNGPYTLDLSAGPLNNGVYASGIPINISGGVIKGGGAAQLGTYQGGSGIYMAGANGNLVVGMEVRDFSNLITAAYGGVNSAGQFNSSGQIINNHLYGSTPTTTVDNGILMGGWINSLIQGNLVENVGGRPAAAYAGVGYPGGTGNGIFINGSSNHITDQYNIVRNGGSNIDTCGGAYANWVYNASYIQVLHNESSGQKRVSGCDGGGFDFDGSVQFSVMQYNYSHDNVGPGYALYMGNQGGPSWNDNEVSYNASVNDNTGDDDDTQGSAFLTNWGGPVVFKQNVIWNTVPGPGKNNRNAAISFQQGCPSAGEISGNLFIASPDLFGRSVLVTMDGQICPSVIWKNNGYLALGGTPMWYQANGGANLTSLTAWQAVVGDVGSQLLSPSAVVASSLCWAGIYGICPGGVIPAPPPPSFVSATWDSAKNPGGHITLSNGNDTATVTGSYTGATILATVGAQAGSGKKYYFEVQLGGTQAGGPQNSGVGLANAVYGNYQLGADANGVADLYGGPIEFNSTALFYPGNGYVGSNARVGVAFDMAAQTIMFTIDGVNWSPPVSFSGISGTIYPAVFSNDQGDTFTAYFAQASWAYPPPSGFIEVGK